MAFRYWFEVSESEQVRASRIVANRRWSTRITYAFFVIVMLVATSLCGYQAARGEGSVILLAATVGGMAGGVGMLFASPYWTVRTLRKNNRAATGLNVYELGDSGLHASTLGTSSMIEWLNIAEAYETRDFILFYVSTVWALLLPKRAVPEGERGVLRNAIRHWVGERAHLRAE